MSGFRSKMTSFLKQFYKIWRLQALLVFIQAGFAGLLYLLFFRENITLVQLFFGEFIASTVVSIYMLFRFAFFSRRDIQLGFVFVIVAFSLLLLPFTPTLFYIYTTLSGLATMTFFTPYNIALFRERRKRQSVQDMTWYWGISIIVSIVGPVLGAYILTGLGLYWFIGITIIIAALGIFFAQSMKPETYRYSPREAWNHLRGLRTIIIIDGGLHRIMRIVPLFGLLYISTELDYGGFLSLMSLVAFVVALQMAKFSDKTHKRTELIWPLSIAAGLATALFGFVDSIGGFIILAVILKGLSVMVEPLRGHVMLDADKNDPNSWISRELFLNVGRMIVMGIAAAFMFAGKGSEMFAVLGFVHILFPVVLYLKRIYGTAR